jgi:hypothetical protein
MTTKTYPECEKLKAVHEKSQTIGEFLEWLEGEKGVTLAKGHEHDEDCDGGPDNKCPIGTDSLYPLHYHTEQLLAEYFKIDLRKVEAEHREMLKNL